MRELIGFEQQLAAALEDIAGPRRPVDPAAIARRAAQAGGTRAMRPAILGRRPAATGSGTTLRLALVAALVAAALVAGGLLVGALTQQPTISPSPAPSSLATTTLPSVEPSSVPNAMRGTFSCAEAQAAAARTTTTWTAGPAPADPSTAENGWIAIWGGDAVPMLYLVDPTTGAPCLLARFENYASPPPDGEGPLAWAPFRGPLVWSPDGQALAFVVVTDNGGGRDLFVWSMAGLAGPLITRHDGKWAGIPSWSPDGSLLAAPDVGTMGVGPTDIWILDRDGGKRAIASGCECHLGQVVWSASGRTIATTTRDGRLVSEGDEDGIVAGSIVDDRLQVVPILADPVSSGFTEQVYGFVDDETLVLMNPSPQRFTAHPIGGGPDRDLGPTRLTPKMLEQSPLSLAPDRSAWLFSRISSYGVLDIGTGAETMLLGTTDGMMSGWAPNSQAIGYVDMLQHQAQGVWVVNRDGTGNRRVIAGPYVWSYGEGTVFAWQPVWPTR
jgi:hypothetical protein